MVEFRDAVAQQDGRQRERKEFRPVQSEARLGVYRRAHAEQLREKRGGTLVLRGLSVASSALGLSGKCDVVEFHKAPEGISLAGREGTYIAIPVEYKRGIPKTDDSDILQVAAQAMCLEEMLCCKIPKGYIYYGETKHRVEVIFTDEVREKVKKAFTEMHKYYEQRYTPKVKISKRCNACSLKDICVPVLNKRKSVSTYIDKMLSEKENE